ncbi:MAG: SPOR domain-containing protein [Bacteroidetes bacterium]|nr:SPOR domain-containing protein [Bacteroidota bacterium]
MTKSYLWPMRLLLLIILFVPCQLFAQPGTIEKQADELVDRHKRVNAAKMSMPGYRIQIYFGSDRTKAQEIRADFLINYPDMPAYLIYQQPNFKVRAGDFRTRLEASGFLNKLDTRFKSAFIVPDEVKLPDL